MAHIENIDDLEAWFHDQVDRVGFAIYQGSGLPRAEETSSRLLQRQQNFELSKQESFEILRNAVQRIHGNGRDFVTIKATKSEKDAMGASIAYKLSSPETQPQNGYPNPYQTYGAPQLGSASQLPQNYFNNDSAKYLRELADVQARHHEERTDFKMQILKLENKIDRDADIAKMERNQSKSMLAKLTEPDTLSAIAPIIGSVVEMLKPVANYAAVAGVSVSDTNASIAPVAPVLTRDNGLLLLRAKELELSYDVNALSILTKIVELGVTHGASLGDFIDLKLFNNGSNDV